MIIALSGVKSAGKDTVARMIEMLTFKPYEQIKFARKLKTMVALLLDCDPKQLEDYGFKEKYLQGWPDVNPRMLLQEFGSTGRKLYQDIWVSSALENINESSNYIISDLRYLNEAAAIKKLGGYAIRIERPIKSNDTHSSETELNDYKEWDYVIHNKGSLEDLAEEVSKMCKKLKL